MDFVVLDTNVVVSALRSKRGASFAILNKIGEAWTPLISVPLILEYEAVGLREASLLKIPAESIEAIVRAFCFFGRETPVYFRLRPSLPDPDDEFLLELAVAGRANAVVTHNVKDFAGAERFGIPVTTPREFLRKIEGEAR
jgi:putative PIN family toxin of toxin-antitoxin system